MLSVVSCQLSGVYNVYNVYNIYNIYNIYILINRLGGRVKGRVERL